MDTKKDSNDINDAMPLAGDSPQAGKDTAQAEASQTSIAKRLFAKLISKTPKKSPAAQEETVAAEAPQTDSAPKSLLSKLLSKTPKKSPAPQEETVAAETPRTDSAPKSLLTKIFSKTPKESPASQEEATAAESRQTDSSVKGIWGKLTSKTSEKNTTAKEESAPAETPKADSAPKKLLEKLLSKTSKKSPAVGEASAQAESNAEELKKEPQSSQSKAIQKSQEEAPETEMDKALPGEDLADSSPLHHGLFRCLAFFTPISLLLLLFLCCWTPFFEGDLLCPKEVANLKIFNGLSDSPLFPGADGVFMMPLFFWMTKALSWLPGVTLDSAIPLSSFLGGFILLLGMWIASKRTQLGRYVPMAAGILLICSPAFLALTNFFGPTPMATGLCLASLGIIGRSWIEGFSLPCMVLGHLLAAAAGLTGGIFYAIIPIASTLVFGLWRLDFARSRRNDAVIGFAVLVGVFAVWAALIVLFFHGSDELSFSEVLLRRPNPCDNKWPPFRTWLFAILPFIGAFFCSPLVKIVKNSMQTLQASRKESAAPILWIALFLTLILAAFAPHTTDVLPAVAISALFAGRALLRFSQGRLKAFFVISSLFLFLTAIALASILYPSFGTSVFDLLGIVMPSAVKSCSIALSNLSWWLIVLLIFLPVFSALAILHVAWRSNTAAAPLVMSVVMVAIMSLSVGLIISPTIASVPAAKLVKKAPAIPFSSVAGAMGNTYTFIMGPTSGSESAPETKPAQESSKPEVPATPAPSAEAPASSAN